jgi:hypothetical protein
VEQFINAMQVGAEFLLIYFGVLAVVLLAGFAIVLAGGQDQ